MSVFKNVNVTKSIKMTSTTDTFNMASVNTTQRDAITNPEVGSLVFNNETENVNLYWGNTVTFDVLVVGGGGAGGVAFHGGRGAGGGGAGGYIYQQGEVRQSGFYNISVGAGAPTPASQTIASQGGNSQFDNLIAIGGGGGAGTCLPPPDLPSSSGGSGGGGSDSDCWQGSVGTLGQGNNGADNNPAGFSPLGTSGSGGGGAGGVGQPNAGTTLGLGGVGASNTITGVLYTYSKGGNGGDLSANNNGTAGVNYGDGGAGASGGGGADNVGGAGANGVVIIRVATSQPVNLVGLTFTSNVDGLDTVYTITSGTGTIELFKPGPWNRCINQSEQVVVNTLIPLKTVTASPIDWDPRPAKFNVIDGVVSEIFGPQTIETYDNNGDYTGVTSTITNNGTRDGAYLQFTFNTPQNNISAFRYYSRPDTNIRDPIEYYWAVSISSDGPWLEVASNNIDNWGPPASPRFVENTVPAISGISYCCVRLIVVRMRNSTNKIINPVEIQVFSQDHPYADLDFEGNTAMNALSVNTIRPRAVSAGGDLINTDVVPNMTAYNVPSPFVASASVSPATFDHFRAFDNDNQTYWKTTNEYAGIYLGSTTTTLSNISDDIMGHWLQIDLGEVKDIRGYTLVYPAGTPNNVLPQTWVVASSLDDTIWNFVDFREFSAWVDDTPQTFTIDNPVEGQYYRIIINKTTNGVNGYQTDVRVYNWELLEATAEFKPEVSIEGNLLITGGTLLNTMNMKQIKTTPENPPSGSNKLYFKSDGKLYRLDSAGTETQIG